MKPVTDPKEILDPKADLYETIVLEIIIERIKK
jgi:hypothetical protein